MRLIAAAVVALLAASPLAAQSLADAARREKERREKAHKSAQPAKSYSEADLKAPKGTTATEGAQPPGGEMGGTTHYEPPAKGSPEGEAISDGGEEGWRARAEAQRKAVGEAAAGLRDLEANLERVRLDREPAAANIMDPQREQKRQAEIFRLQDEIGKARAALEKARQEQAAFEEAARRAGIPPGWIR